VEPLDLLGSALVAVVESSDAIYDENAGEPAPTSTVASEVLAYDQELTVVNGIDRPLFRAYAHAESTLRSLNDLVRSYVVLLVSSEVNVGEVVVARAAVETAARIYWGLAIEGDYRERAARLLGERLRTIEEIAKFTLQVNRGRVRRTND